MALRMSVPTQFTQYAPLLFLLCMAPGKQANAQEGIPLCEHRKMMMSLGSLLPGAVNKSTFESGLESYCKHIVCTQNGLDDGHCSPAQLESSSSVSQIVLEDESHLRSKNKSSLPSYFRSQYHHKWSRKLLQTPGSFDAEEWLDGHDRKRIIDSHYPFSAIGQLDNGCTGTLVGPCHVLTAGHCIYDPSNHKWSDKLGFTPGRTGGGAWEPHGRAEPRSRHVMLGWQLFSDYTADLGLIVLDRRIGDVTGTLGFGNGKQGEIVPLNMAGYPNDKGSGEMWYDYCKGGKNDLSKSNVVYHSCTPDNGNSGSPLWVYGPSGSFREIRGVHTGVVSHHSVMLFASGQAGSEQHPFGVMITHQESSVIRRWITDNHC